MLTKQAKIQPAGGFVIADGGPGFKLVRCRALQRYRKPIKKFLISKRARKKDPRIEKMLLDLSAEIATYDCPPFHHWPNLTPIEKQQALFKWIIKQGRYAVVDLIAAGLAGDFYTTYGPQTLKSPYARAVNIGRAVWYLLKREYKDFAHDNGHGQITTRKIWINKKVRMRSRYAAQRIEACIKKHAGFILEEYGQELWNRIEAHLEKIATTKTSTIPLG